MRLSWLPALLLSTAAACAEPVKIGITTILSGPYADRGQSEQYGAQIALDEINQSGGVLGRPVEAFYADNAANPEVGVPATKRLIEEQHVPVLIGALWTPVTHAIMPVVAEAKIPLVIATSAGQDFVDASGVGGNPYTFKTIPSEVDIARGFVRWLKGEGVQSVAIVADDAPFQRANAVAMAKAATDAGIKVTDQEIVPKGGEDFAALLTRFKAGAPDRVLTLLADSTPAFFRAYEASGWKVPITGRIDFPKALETASPAFRAGGGLADLTGVAVFSPAFDKPGVQAFVASYQARFGLPPTQRSFFVYEATKLVVDAIQRAGADTPEAIEQALKTTAFPSALGGAYTFDDHNHSHTPLLILGVRDGKPAVIAVE